MVRDRDGWQDLVPFWEGLPATLHGFHHSIVEFAPSFLHLWAEGSTKAFLQHVQQGLTNSLQTEKKVSSSAPEDDMQSLASFHHLF